MSHAQPSLLIVSLKCILLFQSDMIWCFLALSKGAFFDDHYACSAWGSTQRQEWFPRLVQGTCSKCQAPAKGDKGETKAYGISTSNTEPGSPNSPSCLPPPYVSFLWHYFQMKVTSQMQDAEYKQITQAAIQYFLVWRKLAAVQTVQQHGTDTSYYILPSWMLISISFPVFAAQP